jgi:hypothetical protein
MPVYVAPLGSARFSQLLLHTFLERFVFTNRVFDRALSNVRLGELRLVVRVGDGAGRKGRPDRSGLKVSAWGRTWANSPGRSQADTVRIKTGLPVNCSWPVFFAARISMSPAQM